MFNPFNPLHWAILWTANLLHYQGKLNDSVDAVLTPSYFIHDPNL